MSRRALDDEFARLYIIEERGEDEESVRKISLDHKTSYRMMEELESRLAVVFPGKGDGEL
jgi:hypothetical protein